MSGFIIARGSGFIRFFLVRGSGFARFFLRRSGFVWGIFGSGGEGGKRSR